MTNQALFPRDLDSVTRFHEWRTKTAWRSLRAAPPQDWEGASSSTKARIHIPSRPTSSHRRANRGLRTNATAELPQARVTEKVMLTSMSWTNVEHVAPTHQVDCYKNRVALEWSGQARTPLLRPRPNIFGSVRSVAAIDAGRSSSRAANRVASIFYRSRPMRKAMALSTTPPPPYPPHAKLRFVWLDGVRRRRKVPSLFSESRDNLGRRLNIFRPGYVLPGRWLLTYPRRLFKRVRRFATFLADRRCNSPIRPGKSRRAQAPVRYAP